MKPLVLINFKTYEESCGDHALELAKAISQVKQKDYQLAIAPSILTVRKIASKVKLPVFAQHADTEYGAHTGSIPLGELKESGAKGVILNHSEYKIQFLKLKEIIKLCRKQELISIACSSTLSEIKRIAAFAPEYIAYEPAELIGGNVSVVDADEKVITKALDVIWKISPGTKLLCGAGVHSRKDLQHALALGAEGVLLAHAVVKARNPKGFLEEFLG